MKYFDDIRLGDRFAIGAHLFTAEEIKAFARRFDPQLFHLDEEAATRSHFGALCASGWHSASMWMRLMVDYRRRFDDERRARGEPVVQLGASPGFRDLKWLRPVYAGDTITYESHVVELRVSNSRPGWGLLSLRNSGTNQAGMPVLSFVSTVFIERRPEMKEAS
jgi:acyl dehydratase